MNNAPSLLDSISSFLPSGWALTHIILLDPEWQVNISNNEHVTVATGETLEKALLAATDKVNQGKFSGYTYRLPISEDAQVPDIIALLGLAPKPTTLPRRRV